MRRYILLAVLLVFAKAWSAEPIMVDAKASVESVGNLSFLIISEVYADRVFVRSVRLDQVDEIRVLVLTPLHAEVSVSFTSGKSTGWSQENGVKVAKALAEVRGLGPFAQLPLFSGKNPEIQAPSVVSKIIPGFIREGKEWIQEPPTNKDEATIDASGCQWEPGHTSADNLSYTTGRWVRKGDHGTEYSRHEVHVIERKAQWGSGASSASEAK